MTLKIYDDYIYTKKLDLKTDILKRTSLVLYDQILKNFGDGRKDYGGQSTMTTQLYSNYNALLYPYPGMHILYKEIKKFFYEASGIDPDNRNEFYIQCWLNVYKKGDYINWHGHWPSECNSWHGFYCVDCEINNRTSSGTLYRIPNNKNEVYVPSENNLLVISKSDGDKHKSTEWLDEENPRITIAFDIVPSRHINAEFWINHWIPI